MDVSLKLLVGKLNATCRKALEGAAELSLSRTNYNVELEHWLLKLDELPNSDLQRVLRHFEIDRARFRSDLKRAVDKFKTGNPGNPALPRYFIRVLNGAWLFASIDFNASRIRSGHLLLGLFADEEMVQVARDISDEWKRIEAEALHSKLLAIMKDSDEDHDEKEPASEPKPAPPPAPARGPKPKSKSKPRDNSRIFISYRRDDAGGWAGRLKDRLVQHFTESNLFMDVDAIEPGLEYAEVIRDSVALCKVLIAVIGRRWLDSTDRAGQRKLDNPEDLVRLEIAAALKKRIRVIPVLLQGSAMPIEKDLPDDIKQLARMNALPMDETRFDHDVRKLIEVLERSLKATKRPASRKENSE